MNLFKILMFGVMANRLMDEKKDGDSGGGNTVTMTKEQFDQLMARLPEPKKEEPAPKPKPEDDKDLASKAKDAADAKAKNSADSKAIESAVNFSVKSAEWVKTNAALLPSEIQGIFEAAEKENYENAVQKASSIKSAITQSFFKQQANLDLLTQAQKIVLEDWLKLTKNGKEEQSQQIFDSIFEPTFEMLKRIKRAELVQQSGSSGGDSWEDKHLKKLITGSQAKYMGVKNA